MMVMDLYYSFSKNSYIHQLANLRDIGSGFRGAIKGFSVQVSEAQQKVSPLTLRFRRDRRQVSVFSVQPALARYEGFFSLANAHL